MQRNHVGFWILLFNTIEGHPANQLRYEVYNEYMKYKSVLNVLNISIRVGFCPSTVSLGFQQCISPRFEELQPNCDIFIYFRNKRTTGGAGSCVFFLGVLPPPKIPSRDIWDSMDSKDGWILTAPTNSVFFCRQMWEVAMVMVSGLPKMGTYLSIFITGGDLSLFRPRSKVFLGRFGLWEWLVTR